MKKSVKIQVNFTNKWLYFLIGILFIVIFSLGVWAYNAAGTGGNSAVFGHSADEIELLNCNVGQAIIKTDNRRGCSDMDLSCRIVSSIAKSSVTLCCDSNEFVTGVNAPELESRASFINSTCASFTSIDSTAVKQIICCK